MFIPLRYCPVLLLLLAVSCGKDQEPPKVTTSTIPVSFTSSSAPRAQEPVQFTADVAGATAYRWHFGDGDSASVANPTHTFRQPGNYTVRLRASSPSGAGEQSQVITVAARTTATIPVFFWFSSPQRAQQAIQFTADAPGATTFSWTFGDGDSTTVANPTHTYQRAGRYTLRLRASGPAGAGQYAMNMDIGRPDTLTPILTKVAGRYFCAKVVEYTFFGGPPVANTVRLPDTIITVTPISNTTSIKVRNYTIPLFRLNEPWRTSGGSKAYLFHTGFPSSYATAKFEQTSDSIMFQWKTGGLGGGTTRTYYGKKIP